MPCDIFKVQAPNRDFGGPTTPAREGSKLAREETPLGGASVSSLFIKTRRPIVICALISFSSQQDASGTKLYLDKEDEQILRDAVVKKGRGFMSGLRSVRANKPERIQLLVVILEYCNSTRWCCRKS